jgi:hypothetical protein
VPPGSSSKTGKRNTLRILPVQGVVYRNSLFYGLTIRSFHGFHIFYKFETSERVRQAFSCTQSIQEEQVTNRKHYAIEKLFELEVTILQEQ